MTLRLAVAFAFALALSRTPAALAQAPGPAQPPAVTVAKPVVKQVVEQDDYTGRFEAVETVEVRARVSGYLDQVAFKDGAIVKKGDLLYVIDKRPYQAAVDQAEAAVVSAQARVAYGQSDLERALALGRSGNITEQVLEQRRQAFETAKADLQGGQAAVRTARLNLGFTEIRAPIGGRTARTLVTAGNLVTADSTLLTTIVSLDPIYFYFDVDERSYLAYSRASAAGGRPSGRQGYDVVVGVTDEKEPTRKGRLDFVDNRIDPASGTIRGRALVPNPDLFLTPGLFGTIRIPATAPFRGVLVPDEAVATDQDRRLVWVVADDGTVSSRVVRTGPRIDGYRLIREGLNGDETVVIAGLQRVRPGIKVAPQMKQLAPTREADASQAQRAPGQ
jgi:membrane fusion protein, multidrug efflux system